MRADRAVLAASFLSLVPGLLLAIWFSTALVGGSIAGQEPEAVRWILAVSGPLSACGLTGISNALSTTRANHVSRWLMAAFVFFVVVYLYSFVAMAWARASGDAPMIRVMRDWESWIISLQCFTVGVLAIVFLQVSNTPQSG